MATQTNTLSDRVSGAEIARAELLDVGAVAAMLDCSRRHVYRLCDAGKMPLPVKLGQLVRWRRAELIAWLDGGCKPICTVRGGV